MALPTNVPGAIGSTRTEKPLGQLCTLIGWSHLWHGTSLPAGFALNDQPLEYHMGIVGGDQVNDIPSTTKGLKILQTSGAVAVDGVVSTGWVNKTGVALASGEYVMAVQV